MAKDVMKIFYYIIAHKNPQQLKLLVNTLQNAADIICIHIDANSDVNEFKTLIPETDNVFFIKNRESVFWGGWSQVKVTILGLNTFVKTDCNYFVPLSGQDFPIKKISDFKLFLYKNRDLNYLSICNCESSWRSTLIRVELFYFVDFFGRLRQNFKSMTRLIHIIESYLKKLQIFCHFKRKLPLPNILHGGSSWFIVNKVNAKIILEEIKNNNKLLKHFKYTVCPDELFFHTIISNTEIVKTVNQNNLRYIRFISGKSNPEIITSNEIFNLPENDFYFARKFDAELNPESIYILIDFINESK